MKKECWRRDKISFDSNINNKIFLVGLILFVALVVSVGFVRASTIGIPHDYSSSSSSSTGSGSAPEQTTPMFKVDDPNTWAIDGTQAAKILTEDPKKFVEGVKKLTEGSTPGTSNSKIDSLWSSILNDGKVNSILNLKSGEQFNSLWDKLGWSNAADTFSRLKNEGKGQELLTLMSQTQITQILQVGFTEKNSKGESIDPAAITSLKIIRKDFLLAVSKSKEANKIYVDLYKSMFKDGDLAKGLTEAGKAGLKNLEEALKKEGMEKIREDFVKAIVHDLIKGLTNSEGKPYAGLQEFKLANDFSLGFDDKGKPVIKFKGENLPIEIENAQVWSNKINAGSEGLKFEKKDGTTLTISTSDLTKDKFKSMKWDIKTGEITINNDFKFNPYARDDGVNKAEHWKLSISQDKVVITGDQKTGWIRTGDKFFTYNRENSDLGAFSVALEKKGEQVISYAQNTDVHLILDNDPWNPQSSSYTDTSKTKSISFRSGEGVAFFGLNEKVIPGLTTGYISVNKPEGNSNILIPSIPIQNTQPNAPVVPTQCGSQGCSPGVQAQQVQQTQISPDYLVNLNGVSNVQVIGTYAGAEKYSMSVTGSNVEVARFNNGNQIYISSGNFKPVPYTDQPAGGFVINPDPKTVNIQTPSGLRYAQVLASAGIQVPGYNPVLTDGTGGQGGTQGIGGGNLEGQANPGGFYSGEGSGATQPNPGQQGGTTNTWDKNWNTNPYFSQIQNKYSTPLKPGENVIVIHSTSGCKYCVQAENYAKNNNLKYIKVSGGSPGLYPYIQVYNSQGSLAKPGWEGWTGSF